MCRNFASCKFYPSASPMMTCNFWRCIGMSCKICNFCTVTCISCGHSNLWIMISGDGSMRNIKESSGYHFPFCFQLRIGCQYLPTLLHCINIANRMSSSIASIFFEIYEYNLIHLNLLISLAYFCSSTELGL